MVQEKFYAVRKGKVPGIYKTWNECKVNTTGFSGAEYACFHTEEDAKNFMNAELLSSDNVNPCNLETYSFVDGSFNSSTNVYGYGGFLVHKGNKIKIQGSGNDKDLAAMRNIAGEILGSQAAVVKAIELGIKEITIFYDYMGIEMWAKGLWNRNKEGTKAYYNYMQSVKDKITIHFVKVKGHTGIEGNEEADKLAKESVGIINGN